MALKLITIDFWNTLFDSSGGMERNAFRQKALKAAIRDLGVYVSDVDYNEAMSASWEYFNNIWLNEMRTPLTPETVKFFWGRLNLPEEQKAIDYVVEQFSICNLIHAPKIIEGARGALERLSDDFSLAIVSDTGFSPGSVLRKLLEGEDILRFFKSFSFSDETGVAKPHPDAFRKVLTETGAATGESLHIGDIELTDIKGAKEIGMKAIKFSGDDSSFMAPETHERTIADADVKSWKDAIIKIYEIHES